MSTIEVEGKKFRVVETLVFHQSGAPAKFVQTEKGERVAVKRDGCWTWWTEKDRVGPARRCEGMG